MVDAFRLSSSVWSAERQFWDCCTMSRSMSLLPMVLLALGAWMLSSLTSQSGFVMNSATPRGSKVAMGGFKDDFYAWKETLSSEDQALLLKQAQNASWQLSVLGLLPSLAAQRGTLLLCRPCMCSKLMFMDFSCSCFLGSFTHRKKSMVVPAECCFFFKLPLLLSIRFQNTVVTYAYNSNIFQRMLKLFKFCFFTLLGMATWPLDHQLGTLSPFDSMWTSGIQQEVPRFGWVQEERLRGQDRVLRKGPAEVLRQRARGLQEGLGRSNIADISVKTRQQHVW